MKLLDEVKEHFSEAKEFIEDFIEHECNKESISVDEVIFLYTCLEAKSQRRKTFFYVLVLGFKAETFSLRLTKYVELNSLSHDIYLRVTWIQFNKSFLRCFFTNKDDLKNSFAKTIVVEYFYNS